MRPMQPTVMPVNRMRPRPRMMASPAPTISNPIRMKEGGKVKGYKNGGCVMGKRGVRNTKMM